MARELGEVQDLSVGDMVRFPLGRGVLWDVIWVADSNRNFWFYADSGLIRRTFERPYGFEVERVV